MRSSLRLSVVRPIGALLLLTMLFAVPRSASLAQVPDGFSQYSSEHEFQLLIPVGWALHLDAAKEFGEDDLKVQADSLDKQQVIKVYFDPLPLDISTIGRSSSIHPALVYLQRQFGQAASNPRRHGFRVRETPDTWNVTNADDAASYTCRDDDGVPQWVDVLEAARRFSVYEPDNLPTAA
jgi:hypothetical protein